MATAAINIPYLSTYCAVPETTISALLTVPDAELVASFLLSLTSKAQEHDRLKATQLRQDVELENAVRNGEAKARTLKSNADNALADVEKIRIQLNNEEATRSQVEAKLHALQTTTSDASLEAESLKAQVKKLSASNRDALALLDAKSTSHDRLSEELSSQQQKIQLLRRENSALQEKYQAADNSLSTAKFREQALQQEIELLRRNNDWLDSELKAKTAEHSKYRKEKNARISELQRSHEDAASTIHSLQRTEESLRKRLEELDQKAENSLVQIAQIQQDAARAEEGFRAELDSSRRLADLHKQSAETAKRRVHELEATLEELKDDAAEEISNVQAELETERQLKNAAEERVQDLELQVERLETSRGPTTPRHGHAASDSRLGTPARGDSPLAAVTPGGSRIRGGLNFTQLYSEYTEMKARIEVEHRRNEKLEATIDDMVRGLESKEPELQELQLDHQRLESEVAELSSLLEQAGHERDAAKRESRKWESKIQGQATEVALLRQQLRDLNAQIKVLLVEIQIRDQGDQLTAADRLQLEQVARNDVQAQALDDMSDTGRFISENLTTFRNIVELQETNEKLLHLTRQLGERMEGEEAQAKQNQQEQERAELETLREKVSRYKDELQALTTQSNSFIRERDMFRRMLSHRGQLPPESEFSNTFGQSVTGPATPRTPAHGVLTEAGVSSPNSKEIAEYNKLLKEMQSHFDAYRQESSVDRTTLKNQVDQLAKDKAELQGVMARGSSQLQLAGERYEMLQANYNLLKSERDELQKRSQKLSESAAKQDLTTQRVAEELIDTKAVAEGARNEIANLKAEKDLWKRIEQRLTDDNHNLIEDRARLSKLLADSQNLYNERDLVDAETRRKLQAQVETMEADLRTANSKMEELADDARKTAMRREYEQEQSRTRIDDLMKTLSSVKEELVGLKAIRDQLSARVEELKIELRGAEERAQAFQIQSTAVGIANVSGVNGESVFSQEQERAVELADLRRDFELSKAELEHAREQVEQYKSISQSSEDELQSLNESHDLYKEEMEAVLAQKDFKIREVEQRVTDISTEMDETNDQLSELRAKLEDANARLDQQRTGVETEIRQLRDERDRAIEEAGYYQADLKAQAEIAQQSQRNYDYELLRHAEATSTLQKVNKEYAELREKVAGLQADTDAARLSLSQSEDSWSTMREKYEQELAEIRTRRDDVVAQNKLLHEQLESVSKQISALQQNRYSEGAEGGDGATSDRAVQNLQEVVQYLRREKEIVDVQYELSLQESRRYKQQLDYTQTQLDDVRLRLDQERQKTSENEQSAISHSKLMETINELNVFRESSVTLRNESRQAQERLAAKSQEAEDLLEQLQPLRARVLELENEREAMEGQMKLLQEDRDRWQQRTNSVLQKYDRIDPAELEALKDQIITLEKARDDALSEQKALQEQIDKIPEAVSSAEDAVRKSFQESREKMVEQFKQRSRDLSGKINEKALENRALTEQRDALQTEVDALGAELSAAKSARDQASSLATAPPLPDDSTAGNPNGANLEQEIAEARTSAESLQARVNQLEQELAAATEKLDSLSSEANNSEPLNDLQTELAAAKAEIRKLQTAIPPVDEESANSAASSLIQNASDIEKHIAPIREELEANHQSRLKQLEDQFKSRTDQMKQQLNKRLADGKENMRAELKQREDAFTLLQATHNEAMAALRAEHEKELAQLKNVANSTLEHAKQQNPPSNEPNPGAGAPSGAENSFNQDSTVKTKSDMSPLQLEWSEAQIKELIDKNAVVKSIIARNVVARVKRETETLSTKLNEEHQKDVLEQLEDARQKAEKARDQAVTMEGKRWGVKISMAEGRARGALAKIEVFEKAANDTPQRPVVEVWAIAKDAKPLASTPSQAAAQLPSGSAAQARLSQQPAAVPASAAQVSADSHANGTKSVSAPENITVAAQPPAKDGSTPAAVDQSQPASQANGTIPPTSKIPTGQAHKQAAASGIPRGGGIPRGSSRPSGLPRGGSVGRGGGAGANRGGRGGVAATMNPGATQFVPGQAGNAAKRPREESGDSGPGKRPRGSAASAGP